VPEQSEQEASLKEECLSVVHIDGARHNLIWVYDRDHSVSVLLDRPEQGGGNLVRLIGAFGTGEGFDVIEALVADYEAHYVKRPRAERIPPRPIEPFDLVPARSRT